MPSRSVSFGMRSRKISNVGQSLDGWPKIYYLELLRASEGTLSRWSRLHLQFLAPTNPHWARVVGFDPFFLCVIHTLIGWWWWWLIPITVSVKHFKLCTALISRALALISICECIAWHAVDPTNKHNNLIDWLYIIIMCRHSWWRMCLSQRVKTTIDPIIKRALMTYPSHSWWMDCYMYY
jgi:hypothetical protein